MFGLGIEEFFVLGIIFLLVWLYYYSAKRINDPSRPKLRWFFKIIVYCFPLIGIYILIKIYESSTKRYY